MSIPGSASRMVELRQIAGHDGHVPGRSFEVAIDANDPQRLRRFWMAALNYVELTTLKEL